MKVIRPHQRLLLLSCLLTGACLACRSAPEQEPAVVATLIRKAQYSTALSVAEKLASERPDDPEAQENYRMASVAWLVERTRRTSLQRRLDEALGYIEQAMEIGSDLQAVRTWHGKVKSELANYWTDIASTVLADGDLEAARNAFERVLVYAPGDPRASEALGNVLLRLNHRQGMSSKYYNEGVKLLNDYWLYEALTRFNYSGKYHPLNERAENRGAQVESLLGGQRAALAVELERSGQFFAANNEYRLALLLEPESEEARLGYERTFIEAKASKVLKEAEMLLLRKRFDEAEEILLRGIELTEQQRDGFEGALAGVEEGRHEEMYDHALVLESDLLFEQAVVAYGALLDQAGYYRDAIARRDTLMSFMDKASDLYARAEAAGDDEERLRLLRQIAVFWPEYRDVEKQISSLSTPQ